MKARADHLFPLAVMGMLAAMTFWLERAARTEPPRAREAARHEPDFVVERFDARRFATDGTLRFTLAAARMEHYPDDETTEIAEPSLTYHATRSLVHVSASRAQVSADGEVVRLSGKVLARREAAPNRPETRVITDELTVYPEQERALTDAQVRITQAGSVITGIGMEMDNQRATLVLKSSVRARIEPRARSPR